MLPGHIAHASTAAERDRRARAALIDGRCATDVKLTAQEMAKLDEVSALPAEYPGWMMAFQGARESAAQILREGRP